MKTVGSVYFDIKLLNSLCTQGFVCVPKRHFKIHADLESVNTEILKV